MLRRRITLPVLSTARLQAVGVSQRHVQQSKGIQQFSYLPPGIHAPRLPWFCETAAPHLSTATVVTPDALPVSMTTETTESEAVTATSAVRLLAEPAELDAILDGRTASKRVATEAARVIVGFSGGVGGGCGGGGVLQSSAGHSGPMRATAARRMSVLAGPTLDTRIGDIVKIDDSLAAEMLPDVVRLLIDPNAEGVENVSLTDFVAMQPKRQLVALSGKKVWHEWLIDSTHYKQVARLEIESPYYDMRALQQAGITTLYQWAEQPELVKVSSYTRSLLDAAVEKSVEAYVDEVTKVVNTSNLYENTLVLWAADIIGKFILERLNITVEQAAAAATPTASASAAAAGATAASGTASAKEMVAEQPAMAAMDGDASTTSSGQVCTLEHYHRLARKVLASVRKEYMAQRQADHGANGVAKVPLDSQAEAEIREKAYATLSDALLKVLEAQTPNMPKELHPLRDYGFLALERLPGLLRQASSVLQLQSVPVRYFVFHSTGDREVDECEKYDSDLYPSVGTDTPATNNNASMSVAAPTLASGVFLAGTTNYNVTLGEWPGFPQPPPSPSMGIWSPDTVQNEYFSVLHRLKRHTLRVARTTLFDTIKGAREYRNGFNAAEALGLQQLFGTAKLVEDRLGSVLNCYYDSASSAKPLHFIEAGHSCGKTSVLERLSKRMAEGGKTAVTVRYSGAATPFTPGLDDHPLALPARFWFRVALASCPYLVRTEELFTRAPKSVMWWANRRNWSWELYQNRIRLLGHRDGAPSSLHAILVDDFDRVLDAMEGRINAATVGRLNGASHFHSLPAYATEAEAGEEAMDAAEASQNVMNRTDKKRGNSNNNSNGINVSNNKKGGYAVGASSLTAMMHFKQHAPCPTDTVEAALAKVTVAVGQLDMVFTGHRVSKTLLAHADAPVRRYFIPLANGIGLQQRMRVLPLVSVLYALHQRSRLEFSGLMYEVLKNCPGLLGYTLEVFWSGRAATMDLRGGAPRLMQWSGTHPLLRSYVPTELFAELPQRNYLLQNLPEARLRLVELLQRQLSSPTGYLTTGVDTTMQDERDGFIVPHSHTTSQVHPFALFTIFTQQDPLEAPHESTVVRAWGEVWAEYCGVVNTMGTTNERKRDAMRVLLHGALLLRDVAVSGAQMNLNLKIPPYGFPLLASATRTKQKGCTKPVVTKATQDIVRKAVAAYKTFFAHMEQTHFPFRPSVGLNGGCDVVSFAGTTLALYDLVTTPEALQDISYRFAEALLGVLHCLEKNVLPQNKIRQLHYVSVVSIDQTSSIALSGGGSSGINSGSTSSSSSGNSGAAVAGGAASPVAAEDVFAAPPSPVVPYFLDMSAVFEDDVIDRLRALQETLGISKEYRTLNDLLDELESTHRVYVHQDVVASQGELESLLSTTLMQLVPDATVLRAYTPEVVSPDTLLMDLLEDDEEEEGFRGAEVEEMRRDVALTREVATTESFADAEHVQESAELLEALLNDAFADPQQQREEERATNDTAHAALLNDMAMEDAINNNIPVTVTTATNPNNGNSTQQAMPVTPMTANEDALAWLHDIVTPSSSSAAAGDQPGGKASDVIVTSTLSGAPPRRQGGGGGPYVSLSSEDDVDMEDAGEGENEKPKVDAQKKASTSTGGSSSNRQRLRQQQSKSQHSKPRKKSPPVVPATRKKAAAAAVVTQARHRMPAGGGKKRSHKTSAATAASVGGKKNKKR
ncbi:hypothetical protein DQ04_08951000 [Trypanosoma grayi]|uniref:hypothetical protein n=1 Tax=Trypanosoma grayi TaxID=71804 RepID=UPI0004F48E0B|nr:hypothetical protein DQ04_08951000 [Trypanosoma grayi]KEG07732.1 hypothetical protein DQ04_08951000 [Trypanosoma grayi]